MSGIGHNGGPTIERGQRWRAYQWRQAQKALMPKTIPLAIVKMRLRRAPELGRDYKTYAAIRQATGRDICAFLFSSNALGIIGPGQPRIPEPRADKLAGLKGAGRLALVYLPHDPTAVAAAEEVIDAATRAPDLRMPWSGVRAHLGAFVRDRHLVGDQVVIVGDTALEAEWTTAARAAGYVSAERYFGT